MRPESWNFPGHESDPAGELWLPDKDAPAPAVVLAPDLLARAGKGLASALAPELAARGFVTLVTAPSAGCETSRFNDGTLRERIGDLSRAVTALFERMAAAGSVDIRKIALVGHGLGGTAAIAEASHDSRVGAAIAIGAPRTPSSLFKKSLLDTWLEGRPAKLKDPATGEEHALGPALANDWKAREHELDHAFTARTTEAPVLWVHGTEDEVVSVEDSRRAYWKHPEAGRRARLVEVAGALHDFGVPSDKAPALESGAPGPLPAHAKKLADAIVEMLDETFGGAERR